MATAGTTTKYEALYTWRFSERSLLIRLYLFVYGDEKRSSINFCKLFWGTCFLPLTLPLTVLLTVFAVVGRAVRAAALGIGHVTVASVRFVATLPFIAAAAQALAHRQQEAAKQRTQQLAAARAAAWQLEEQQSLGYVIWVTKYNSEVPPPKPTASRRLMEGGAALGDRIAAWWQAHPDVGRNLDRTLLLLGRIVVRGVFYPLMLLVPIALTTLAAWEVWHHRSGLVSFSLIPLRFVRHFGWLAVKFGGILLAALVAGVVTVGVAAVVFAGVFWISGRFADRQEARFERMTPAQQLEYRQKAGRWTRWLDGGVPAHYDTRQTWGSRTTEWSIPVPQFLVVLLDVIDFATIRCGRLLGRGWRYCGRRSAGARRSIRYCGRGVGKATLGTGRALATTGRFFVDGHHAVKTRTCPRILIDSER